MKDMLLVESKLDKCDNCQYTPNYIIYGRRTDVLCRSCSSKTHLRFDCFNCGQNGNQYEPVIVEQPNTNMTLIFPSCCEDCLQKIEEYLPQIKALNIKKKE